MKKLETLIRGMNPPKSQRRKHVKSAMNAGAVGWAAAGSVASRVIDFGAEPLVHRLPELAGIELTRRHQGVAQQAPLPTSRSRLDGTIYQCPECEARYLAEQWCPGCSRPCRRLGSGGICPYCEEMITIAELTDSNATAI